MNARYYDGAYGKFLSQDPVFINAPEEYLSDPQQANSYSYSRNNPLRFVDKTGERVSEYQPYLYSGKMSYEYGQAMGKYRGVTSTSAGHRSGDYDHPYQCVELAKAFAWSQYGIAIGTNGNGRAYGNMDAASSQSFKGNYSVYTNGGSAMPQENDFISWNDRNNEVGHVGVVTEVVFDNKSGAGYVYTIEQNVDGPGVYSYPLSRSYNDKGEATYTVTDNRWAGYSIQGWSRTDNQSRLSDTPTYTTTQHTPATKPPVEKKN